MHNQFKVFHWQTQRKPGSFAQHEAFGKAYEELDPLIDDFIEIFQGKNGAIMGRDGFTLKLMNLSDNAEEVMSIKSVCNDEVLINLCNFSGTLRIAAGSLSTPISPGFQVKTHWPPFLFKLTWCGAVGGILSNQGMVGTKATWAK